MAIGTTIDPSYSYPLPMLGIDYLNFQFGSPNQQLAVLFAGVAGAADDRATTKKTPDDKALMRAFYPLTLPLTVDPGAISVAITLGANHAHGVERMFVAFVASLCAVGLISITVWLAKTRGRAETTTSRMPRRLSSEMGPGPNRTSSRMTP